MRHDILKIEHVNRLIHDFASFLGCNEQSLIDRINSIDDDFIEHIFKYAIKLKIENLSLQQSLAEDQFTVSELELFNTRKNLPDDWSGKAEDLPTTQRNP